MGFAISPTLFVFALTYLFILRKNDKVLNELKATIKALTQDDGPPVAVLSHSRKREERQGTGTRTYLANCIGVVA